MPMTADQSQAQTTTLIDLGAIFVSLELSKSRWLVTALSPGSKKMSHHTVTGGDIAGLFACFAALRQKVKRRKNTLYPLVVIQEVGRDGFWLGRVLSKEAWIESHIVEAASIAADSDVKPAVIPIVGRHEKLTACRHWELPPLA